MFDRRRVLAALAALFLPAPLARAASPVAAPVAPVAATGLRIVDGWIVTERDLAEIDRLAR